MGLKIFIVNPGSTSTKLAIYNHNTVVFEKNIEHNIDKIKEFPTAIHQLDFRIALILEQVEKYNIDLKKMDVFVGRGGLLRPLKGGTYLVNEKMLEDLKSQKYGEHVCNLGAVIADILAKEYGKNAYVVNPVVVDELMEEARITGLPEIKRITAFHALNHKAIAKKAAKDKGIDYFNSNIIVAHIGGGISIGMHSKGSVIDVNNALGDGPFTPERAGTLPTLQLVDMCYSGQYTKQQIKKRLIGEGGFVAHTGSSDIKYLLDKADNEQDKKEAQELNLLFDAFIYNISKSICALCAAISDKPDLIVLTGGVVRSSYIAEKIKKRVSFLSEVLCYPGEDEMWALAQGVVDVLENGQEVLTY